MNMLNTILKPILAKFQTQLKAKNIEYVNILIRVEDLKIQSFKMIDNNKKISELNVDEISL